MIYFYGAVNKVLKLLNKILISQVQERQSMVFFFFLLDLHMHLQNF